jgi:RNA-directed DNA polymerase
MVKTEDMMTAYFDCHKHKASSPDAIRFDINLFENITDLVEQVNSRTYEPLPSITFVVSRPVYREVFAANFRDIVIIYVFVIL